MHGKDAVVEEILDWRPYDYVTDRTILATPDGPVKLLHTIEFEPTTTGTTIHMRYAAPKSRRQRAMAEQLGAAAEEAIRGGLPLLVDQLEEAAATAKGGMGGVPEPALPIPDPDGALGALGPTPAGHGGRGGS